MSLALVLFLMAGPPAVFVNEADVVRQEPPPHNGMPAIVTCSSRPPNAANSKACAMPVLTAIS